MRLRLLLVADCLRRKIKLRVPNSRRNTPNAKNHTRLPPDLATDPTAPFCFLMDASMLGVGVGFDTKGAGTINVVAPGSAAGLEVGCDG